MDLRRARWCIESRRLVTDHAIVGAVLARQARRVFDLGCGEGWLVRALAEHGIESVGVDGSPPLIEAAQAAGAGAFHVCSYNDLVADPSKVGDGFDVITANFALLDAETVPLLSALRLVLAPGGAVVVQTVHPWTVGGVYRDGWREENFGRFPGVWQPMPWYFRTLETWLETLQESGYVITEVREPRHPDTQAPLSLLLVAEPEDA
ncbi:MAG: class I SAM-dependent methyltransferase [Aquisalimonadaceae bacterium]